MNLAASGEDENFEQHLHDLVNRCWEGVLTEVNHVIILANLTALSKNDDVIEAIAMGYTWRGEVREFVRSDKAVSFAPIQLMLSIPQGAEAVAHAIFP